MSLLKLPDFCLVVLIGASGSGKSTFAAKHFLGTEVVSSDRARGLVADDENDQTATGPAFEVVHFIIEKRLASRRLTVVDATNVRPEDRRGYIQIARKYHSLPVAIVINPGEDVCHDRNAIRSDRQFGPHVVRNQTRTMKRGLRGLAREGFRQIYEFRSVAEIETVQIERQPLWTDRRADTGPFDIIGDVHGCCDELESLLTKLDYEVAWTGEGDARQVNVRTPAGRKVAFIGDLVDRGPRSPDVLLIAMSMVEAGTALCIVGNHENKFLRWLNGRNVKPTHGLAETIAQLDGEPEAFRSQVKSFIDKLVSHYWLDGGALCIAHAGLKENMIGRASGEVRSFAMYGETTGETDEFGLPVRYNWAADYRGATRIVYGHTPVPEAEWLNGTICIDTGCVFGGKLTALRWPEQELISVSAARTYFEPARPLVREDRVRAAQAQADDMLDLDDVSGKRVIATDLFRSVMIPEPNSAAALEVMSRFAMHPKWLIYLPPTMSPSETSHESGLLEHPAEAFAYFRRQGVRTVVCEEKHMGSRAVIVVCRDDNVAQARFGTVGPESGAIYTRTGRAFFDDMETTEALLGRIRSAMDRAGLWERLQSEWAVFDAEIMPWSAKATTLIQRQYAPVASAARISSHSILPVLRQVAARGIDVAELAEHIETRLATTEAYAKAYRHYCWAVKSLDDFRIAPFHLLASEGAVHLDKDHRWHMETTAELASAIAPVLMATAWRAVDVENTAAVAEVIEWWLALTAKGGEGFVMKPLDFICHGKKGLAQPALKCRGKEYLRIIYGPEYDRPEHLERLRERRLGRKRVLALREFALGLEGLTRFVAREPLRRVHECVFGVLAMESEPVDPRL